MTDLTNYIFDHFSDIQDHLEKYPDFALQIEKSMSKISSAIQKFKNKFCEFKNIRGVIEYMSFSF